ncbi:unnamed protein product [Rotaria socialis]|uniref:Uncharacterized protein n=2 Tax=Rotaria socialis TaxID=392032 RepID=A0A820FDJ4_9BILA|nr:unnamed protein product [Rotaria socialis]CAF4261309.1 unnamed protein product [Rotaria socialis]CAF4302971.1 unnamed protein product [Rotaria socialis]CAF4371146.1 unnamed protein product [Rotaria socialis]
MVRMSSSPPSATAASNSNDVSPQQLGKAFVVQYYRLLHEHPESLHRFYSSSSTFMHDDPNTTVTGLENIAKRIEELSLKQRHVKIRQVDCHSTVGASVVVQVCGEISSTSIIDNQTPIMKRFVQTFVLAPAVDAKQKYYVHNDIFRYQDDTVWIPTIDNTSTKISSPTTAYANEETSFGAVSTKSTSKSSSAAAAHIQFSDNITNKKKEDKSGTNTDRNANVRISATPVDKKEKNQETEQLSKPKSYRDAIGKNEKVDTTLTTNENQPKPVTDGTKAAKASKQKASKSGNRSARAPRGHPQDVNDYYDDSWYYRTGEEAYLHTGYTDDQEIFIGNLSAQVTEAEIHELFRPYGRLLLVRIGNTGSQVGAANFAFVVCQSIEMAKAIVSDRESLLKSQRINVEAKKRRPFSHTFRPTYPTAASPTNYQSTGYPASYYEHTTSIPFHDGGAAGRGTRRGGKTGLN